VKQWYALIGKSWGSSRGGKLGDSERLP